MGHPSSRAAVIAVFAAILLNSLGLDGQEPFRSGVELVNVTATVTDRSGRFVSGLQQSDFVVYEDDQPVEITHFTAERVPVSLGIVLDTSGSMAGRKMDAARAAVRRLLVDLLGPQDEFFLYRFDHTPRLVEGWTSDRSRMSSALQRMHPEGGTALYDAVAKALPLLKSGRHRKKALLVISDGIDTSSDTRLQTLKQLIRESEALVYAIGIDAQTTTLTPSGGTELPAPSCGSSDDGRSRCHFRYQGDGHAIRRFPGPLRGRARQNHRECHPPTSQVPPGSAQATMRSMRPHCGISPTTAGAGWSSCATHAICDPATGRIADELSKQVPPGLPQSWLSRRETGTPSAWKFAANR